MVVPPAFDDVFGKCRRRVVVGRFAGKTRMFNDCCASFELAGLVVGAEKTRWSSSMVLDGVVGTMFCGSAL